MIVDFPLESIHKSAFKAAEAVRCSGDQGKYWEMHDRVFASQGPATFDKWDEHAAAVGLDAARFKTCLDSGKHAADIRKDMAQAQAAGLTGTPHFYLAVPDGTGGTKVKTVRSIRGAQPFDGFKAQIDAALAEQR